MTAEQVAPSMTADWNGTPALSRSRTWRDSRGGAWASRRVRPDGTIRLLGKFWKPKDDVQIRPSVGEWLLVYAYSTGGMTEWTAPADPDGFIRRVFWQEQPA